MTDRTPRRIDLSALASDGEDRVVAAVMSRLRSTPQPGMDSLELLARGALRPALALAGALVAAAALLIVRGDPTGSAAPPASVVAAWVDKRHVPTNGELLMEFGGYNR